MLSTFCNEYNEQSFFSKSPLQRHFLDLICSVDVVTMQMGEVIES